MQKVITSHTIPSPPPPPPKKKKKKNTPTNRSTNNIADNQNACKVWDREMHCGQLFEVLL